MNYTDQFIQNVFKTEKKLSGLNIKRWQQNSLIGNLNQLINCAERLDKRKKEIIYNKKSDPNFDYLGPEIATQLDAQNARLVHGLLGLIGEASGELSPILHSLLSRGHLTQEERINLEEELGDCLWYIPLVCAAIGTTVEAVMAKNSRKLIEGRYGQGYSDEAALMRDLGKERKLLNDTD